MADEPNNKAPNTKAPPSSKPEKPSDGGGLKSGSDLLAEVGIILLVLLVVSNLFMRYSSGEGFLPAAAEMLKVFFSKFKVFSVIISAPLVLALVYLSGKMNALRTEEKKLLYPEKTETAPQQVINLKWQRVVDHLESENSSDWKLAIIEADIILGEMLDKMGYHGESIGEKLKQIERSDFLTIDKAWEAHKIRNLIAHEGASFELTRKEAFRAVGLYKEVFEEFFFI